MRRTNVFRILLALVLCVGIVPKSVSAWEFSDFSPEIPFSSPPNPFKPSSSFTPIPASSSDSESHPAYFCFFDERFELVCYSAFMVADLIEAYLEEYPGAVAYREEIINQLDAKLNDIMSDAVSIASVDCGMGLDQDIELMDLASKPSFEASGLSIEDKHHIENVCATGLTGQYLDGGSGGGIGSHGDQVVTDTVNRTDAEVNACQENELVGKVAIGGVLRKLAKKAIKKTVEALGHFFEGSFGKGADRAWQGKGPVDKNNPEQMRGWNQAVEALQHECARGNQSACERLNQIEQDIADDEDLDLPECTGACPEDPAPEPPEPEEPDPELPEPEPDPNPEPEPDPTPGGPVADCIDAESCQSFCERQKEAWDHFKAMCELSNWADYNCVSYILRKNGCVTSENLTPMPGTDGPVCVTEEMRKEAEEEALKKVCEERGKVMVVDPETGTAACFDGNVPQADWKKAMKDKLCTQAKGDFCSDIDLNPKTGGHNPTPKPFGPPMPKYPGFSPHTQ